MELDLLEDYSTTHLPLAAFLKMSGLNLTHIESNGTQGVFHFSAVPRQYILGYNTGKYTVEPDQFAKTMSSLTQAAKRVVAERRL